jgi:hypothetical protein
MQVSDPTEGLSQQRDRKGHVLPPLRSSEDSIEQLGTDLWLSMRHSYEASFGVLEINLQLAPNGEQGLGGLG